MKSFSKIKRKQRQFPRFNLLLRHQLLTLSFGVSKFVERIVNLIHMCSAHSWYIYAIVKRKHQHQHQHNHNPNKNTNQPCKCIHAHFHKSHFTTPDYTADVTSDVMWIATKMLTNIEPLNRYVFPLGSTKWRFLNYLEIVERILSKSHACTDVLHIKMMDFVIGQNGICNKHFRERLPLKPTSIEHFDVIFVSSGFFFSSLIRKPYIHIFVYRSICVQEMKSIVKPKWDGYTIWARPQRRDRGQKRERDDRQNGENTQNNSLKCTEKTSPIVYILVVVCASAVYSAQQCIWYSYTI